MHRAPWPTVVGGESPPPIYCYMACAVHRFPLNISFKFLPTTDSLSVFTWLQTDLTDPPEIDIRRYLVSHIISAEKLLALQHNILCLITSTLSTK